MVKSCVMTDSGSLHIVLFTEMPLSYELWKQSYGNRVIVQPNRYWAMSPTIFELWVMKTENWIMETSHPNSLLTLVSPFKRHSVTLIRLSKADKTRKVYREERTFRTCLVTEFKLTFSHFKQYYTYFYTLFHPHVFQKSTNNNSQTTLPNTLLCWETSEEEAVVVAIGSGWSALG